MPHERTRIVLVDIKRLARQIIEYTAAHHPQLEIVAHVMRPVALLEAIERTDAECVITGFDDEAEVAGTLRERPGVMVLAVAEDEREAFLYQLLPHKRRLGQLSPPRLLEVLTDAVEQDRVEVVAC
jgi:hypothetical protein